MSLPARGAPVLHGLPIRCSGVRQVYEVDGEEVIALHDIELDLTAGEAVALFGPSGSGKSTLTSLLAGLRRPTAGDIWLGADLLTRMTESELLTLRGQRIGIVLQNPSRSLLPYGTAEDNIRFAQRAMRRSRRDLLPTPIQLLEQLGLGQLAGQPAGRLSGGEQQRLSVAVAMACDPQLLLADEPTSQLDGHNRDLVVELLRQVHEHSGATLVVVTHDDVVAEAMTRRVTLAEGAIVDHGHRDDIPGLHW
jgi:ABC-type lipoprotein export system ATPase subunit